MDIYKNNLIKRPDFPMQMSINIKDDKINEHVKNAQDRDLKPLMDCDLFSDMVSTVSRVQQLLLDNPAYEMTDSEEAYMWLFNGHNYGSPERTFDGLKFCIAYYAYGRLLVNNDLHVNAGGNSYKITADSERPSSRVIDQAAKQANSVAYGYWLDALDFLNAFPDRFQYFSVNTDCCKSSNKNGGRKSAPRFSPVRPNCNG